MKIKKNWIKMNGNDEVQNDQVEVITEEKEEKKMSFFAKHKKGLIIGGLGTLAAGAVGLFLASKKDSDDDYEDYDFDEFDDEEIAEDLDSDKSES